MSAKLNEMSQHSGLDMAKNPFPSEAYSVVFADVNTGLNEKGSRGDEVAWSLPDFQGFSQMSKMRTRQKLMWLLCFCTVIKDRYEFVSFVFFCGCLSECNVCIDC